MKHSRHTVFTVILLCTICYATTTYAQVTAQPYKLTLTTAAANNVQQVGQLGVITLTPTTPNDETTVVPTITSTKWYLYKLANPDAPNNYSYAIDTSERIIYFSSTEETNFIAGVVYSADVATECDPTTGECSYSTELYHATLMFSTRNPIPPDPQPDPPNPNPTPNPQPDPNPPTPPTPSSISKLYTQYNTLLTPNDKKAINAVTTEYVASIQDSSLTYNQLVSGWNMEVYYYVRAANEGTSDQYGKLMQAFSDKFVSTVTTLDVFKANVSELGEINKQHTVKALPDTGEEATSEIDKALDNDDTSEINSTPVVTPRSNLPNIQTRQPTRQVTPTRRSF